MPLLAEADMQRRFWRSSFRTADCSALIAMPPLSLRPAPGSPRIRVWRCFMRVSQRWQLAQTSCGQASSYGILFDLGVSSPQLDDAARGFSFMQDGPLDMRMSKGGGASAADIVNGASEAELIRIFREFGE